MAFEPVRIDPETVEALARRLRGAPEPDDVERAAGMLIALRTALTMVLVTARPVEKEAGHD